ncbi:MAG TPA: acetamidase/formamidase family protein [Steroidobacteraceae bacterium]|nr:acetamidase/formamidase family protein [Steroidobacteraceae bacterium]
MTGDSSFQGCCPAHDPCPRHVSAVETAAAAPCAMRVEGTNGNSLEDILEHRSISRRDLVRFAGLTATASAFSVGSAASAVPQQIAAGGAPVFDPHKVGTVHTLSSNNDTVRVGTMDPAAPVVLTIRSGDVVSYPNTWVNWGNEAKEGMSFAEREPIRKRYPQGPYSLIGPVAVEGAEPGDVIECRMLRLRPISWGWNSAPKGVGALPGDFEEPYLHYLHFDAGRKFTDFGAGVRIPLAPIQGVMAAQPAGDKPVSAILSGHYGGNIVLRELVEGTALFLPVEVSGGRLWTGDSHAAQGDGVVDQTAIETAMEDLRIQYVLHKGIDLVGPIAETPSHWIVMGFGQSIEDALTASLRQTIDWLSRATSLSKLDVYALSSIAASFRITQYAHQTNTVYTSVPAKTVHGMLPKQIFNVDLLRQIATSVRPGS